MDSCQGLGLLNVKYDVISRIEATRSILTRKVPSRFFCTLKRKLKMLKLQKMLKLEKMRKLKYHLHYCPLGVEMSISRLAYILT